MKRTNHALGWTGTALVLLVCGTARAAGPTVRECVAASDAAATSNHDHRLRAERAELLVCASATCPRDIRKDCVAHVEEVNSQLPTIIFSAADGSGADLTAVTVTIDGEPLTDHLDGTALALDPGDHLFKFEAAGTPPVERHLVIREGEKGRREQVVLGAPVLPVALPGPAVEASRATTRSRLGAQRIAAIVTAAVGVGTAFGIEAISKHNDAKSTCPNAQCATPNGSTLWSSAESAGNVSTIGLIAGGVAVAGGAVLWLTGKPTWGTSPSAQVGLGLGRLELKGTW